MSSENPITLTPEELRIKLYGDGGKSIKTAIETEILTMRELATIFKDYPHKRAEIRNLLLVHKDIAYRFVEHFNNTEILDFQLSRLANES